MAGIMVTGRKEGISWAEIHFSSFEISKSTSCDPTSPTRPHVLILPNSSTKTRGHIYSNLMGPSIIQTTTVHILSGIIFSSIHSTIYYLCLNTTPLFLCSIFLLSIHQLMDINAKSTSWLLWRNLSVMQILLGLYLSNFLVYFELSLKFP